MTPYVENLRNQLASSSQGYDDILMSAQDQRPSPPGQALYFDKTLKQAREAFVEQMDEVWHTYGLSPVYGQQKATYSSLIEESFKIFDGKKAKLQNQGEGVHALQSDIYIIKDMADVIEDVGEKVLAVAIATENADRNRKAFVRYRRSASSVRRQLELLHPTSSEDVDANQQFWRNLVWMVEQGGNEDLACIEEIRKSPPMELTPQFARLLDRAQQRILARIVENCETAYATQREVWERKYAGQYIAVVNEHVIDFDQDYDSLVVRLEETKDQRDQLYAYVIEVGSPTPTISMADVRATETAVPYAEPLLQPSEAIGIGRQFPVPDAVLDGTYQRAIDPLSILELAAVVKNLREMVGGFPLSIIVDGWEHPAARQFWKAMEQGSLGERDKCWFLGDDRGSADAGVYLNLQDEWDRDFADSLIADLLFVAAADESELRSRLAKWDQGAWLLIVAAPDVANLDLFDRIGLPHLRYSWNYT